MLLDNILKDFVSSIDNTPIANLYRNSEINIFLFKYIMGLDFRGRNYRRDITLGKRTIKDGEKCIIFNRYGQHSIVSGPKLQYLFCSTIRFLEKFIASPTEYLVVRNQDGTIEHLPGPLVMYENPMIHQSIEKKSAIILNHDEVLLLPPNIISTCTESPNIVINIYFPKVNENEKLFRVINTGIIHWKIEKLLTENGFYSMTISYKINDLIKFIQSNTNNIQEDMFCCLSSVNEKQFSQKKLEEFCSKVGITFTIKNLVFSHSDEYKLKLKEKNIHDNKSALHKEIEMFRIQYKEKQIQNEETIKIINKLHELGVNLTDVLKENKLGLKFF